jgi:two-component system OmpR family sensor kinase
MNSLFRTFQLKLTLATLFMLVFLTMTYYQITKAMLFDNAKSELTNNAMIVKNQLLSKKLDFNTALSILDNMHISIDILSQNSKITSQFTEISNEDKRYLSLSFLANPSSVDDNKIFLKVTKDITNIYNMLQKITEELIRINIIGLGLILLYAFLLSKNLLNPIIGIANSLSSMDEKNLKQLRFRSLPIEFQDLAKSVNFLTTSIQNYVKYQKELFIGIAHELKTPLAVMKLKSEITLRKPREKEKYEDVLRLHIDSINDMNKMITSILDIGRQEGAQFDNPEKIDLIALIRNMGQDFQSLAKEQNKSIVLDLSPKEFITFTQPTLFKQIIRNFLQNALKFTPENKTIILRTKETKNGLKLEVIDEGIGIEENINLFAPFVRNGKKEGAGLGLFLAKSAADTLGGYIKIRNREDGTKGAVASFSCGNCPIK